MARVLRLVAQGFKYKEVATNLDLTERTVKFQKARSSTGCNSGIAARSSNRPGAAAGLTG
jgi:FixJ family two-component response regulator